MTTTGVSQVNRGMLERDFLEVLCARLTLGSTQQASGENPDWPVVFLHGQEVCVDIVDMLPRQWHRRRASKIVDLWPHPLPHMPPDAVRTVWKACAHHGLLKLREAGVTGIRVTQSQWQEGVARRTEVKWTLGPSVPAMAKDVNVPVAMIGEDGRTGEWRLMSVDERTLMEILSDDVASFTLSANERFGLTSPVVVRWDLDPEGSDRIFGFRVTVPDRRPADIPCAFGDYREVARSDLVME